MPRVFPAALLAAVLLTATGPADGQPPPDKRPPIEFVFKRADGDADGKITRKEFDAFAEKLPRLKDNADRVFRRLDANADGTLTAAEFKALADLAPRPGAGKAEEKPAAKAPVPGADKAAEPTPDQLAFFEKKIRPVLVTKCYGCHSADAEKVRADLLLDTRDGLRAGGASGPAVVPGDPKKSPLIHGLHGSNDAAQMPPKEKLSAVVIADFEAWVKMGAPDPRTGPGAAKKADAIDIEKGRQHWAFQPPKKTAPPAVTNAAWPASDLDRFVLAKLEDKHLSPVGDADKRALIRRATFDLTGLPPTPRDVEAFLADQSLTAFEKVVDKLLASPAFGETWGRHWLDVARYAESSGKEQNVLYPHAWRYRDYVVAAFNADKPYDRFLKEQLAGDLLPAVTDDQKAEHLIATGYLAVGPKSHNAPNPQFRLDLADEQIDAVTQGMLGLTVACARCHDHKFDPVPQKDYYALAGIFTSTNTLFGTAGGLQARQSAPLVDLPEKANVTVPTALSQRELDFRKDLLERLKKERTEAIAEARKDGQPPVQLVIVSTQITVLEKQLSNFAEDGTPKKLAMAAADKRFPADSPLYVRGEPEKPGPTVPRGFVQVLSTGKEPKITDGSGRKELAEWVASAANPLTARVFVNRAWHHLFGRGLVPTPDNFGTTGQPPSHPELLDFLAVSFVENGWSVKHLVRSLVLSRTYRLASEHHAGNAAADPENVYLWRMAPRRLTAEAVRDAMFAVSGTLDKTPPAGSPVAKFEGPVQVLQRFGRAEDLNDTAARSVYLPVIRGQVAEALELFDFAEPSLVTGAREDTSVPAQGLFLLNNPGVMKLADKTADRLMKEYLSPTERIDAGFRLAFGRPATRTETAAAERFLTRFQAAEAKASRRTADVEKAAWAAFAQALFAAAEFRYLD
ncbi:MAG: DUF1553 domain-containing protein [Fimbriiglobus sp.]